MDRQILLWVFADCRNQIGAFRQQGVQVRVGGVIGCELAQRSSAVIQARDQSVHLGEGVAEVAA